MDTSLEKGDMVFYTTLDCVLDTRLGCLRRYYPEKFATEEAAMTTLVGYGARRYERFPGIGCEEFVEQYKKRDKSVLPLSAPTLLIDEIVKFGVQVQADNVAQNTNLTPVLALNVYPYSITDEKELEELRIALSIMTCNEFRIQLMDIPTKNLTAKYCKEHFACMAMYDYVEWLDTNSIKGHFEQAMLPEVTLMAPQVWFNDKVNEEDFERQRDGRSVVDTLEVLASFYVNLQFVPVYLFCYKGALAAMQFEQTAKEVMASMQKHQSAV